MTLTINAIDPLTVGAILDSKNGLRVTPERKGGNPSPPLRDGAIFTPGKKYSESSMVLNYLIKAVDPATGLVTLASPKAHYEKNVSDFLRIIHSDYLILDNLREDGSHRQCLSEIMGVVKFDLVAKSKLWNKVSLNLKVINAFWESLTTTTISSFTLSTGGTRTLTELAEAEAPMSDMIVTLGPSTNPQISQASTGVYMKYNGVISSGRVLNINTLTGALTTTGGTSWTPDPEVLVHSGDSRLFSVRPERTGGAPIITINHTGGGTMQTSMVVRRKFMTG